MNREMPFKERILARLIYIFYKTWYRTLRIEVINPWWKNPAYRPEGPLIVAHWHEDDMALIGRYVCFQFHVIISQSKDGNLLNYVMEKLGCRPVRGSSSRGGAKALLTMVKILKKNSGICAITIDGPRGPRHKAKPGLVMLAQKTGAQILTLSAAAQHRFIFKKSWSQTYLPLPFTKVVHFIDPEPLEVPADCPETEQIAIISEIEERLSNNHKNLYDRVMQKKGRHYDASL